MTSNTNRFPQKQIAAKTIPALCVQGWQEQMIPWDTVIAFDLGRKTGFAVLTYDGDIISGTKHFGPSKYYNGHGETFLTFSQWLDELISPEEGPPLCVIYEQVRAHQGTAAAHMYGAFWGLLMAWCQKHGVTWYGIEVSTLKKHATGKGNATKEDVIAAMQALGFTPKDDNEADALALLNYAVREGLFGGLANE